MSDGARSTDWMDSESRFSVIPDAKMSRMSRRATWTTRHQKYRKPGESFGKLLDGVHWSIEMNEWQIYCASLYGSFKVKVLIVRGSKFVSLNWFEWESFEEEVWLNRWICGGGGNMAFKQSLVVNVVKQGGSWKYLE